MDKLPSPPPIPVPPELGPDFSARIAFIAEIERLKLVYRQNVTIDGSRAENSAEHSWHIALMALLLRDQSPTPDLDLFRVVRMLLIHDIVEIDHGDVFLYDEQANQGKAHNEQGAAARIFGLLPEPERSEFLELWEEFEARETPEARYAAAIDNLQPLLNHYLSNGVGVRKHNLAASQVVAKKRFIGDVSPGLWSLARSVIELSTENGLYRKA